MFINDTENAGLVFVFVVNYELVSIALSCDMDVIFPLCFVFMKCHGMLDTKPCVATARGLENAFFCLLK